MNYQPEKIYIEAAVSTNSFTQKILARFPQVQTVIIENLPEFIKSSRQLRNKFDKQVQPLLLAKQKGRFLEKCPGTKEHLCCNYYTLNIGVGCPFDCTYCFLQSYATNPFYTIYVNVEDMLHEIKQKVLPGKRIRIGTGEFTDSLALEGITNWAGEFLPRILSISKDLVLELKTKSANISWLANFGFEDQLVLAWSLNPRTIVASEEKYAAALAERLAAAQQAATLGYRVAFHFDPIIYGPEWPSGYSELVEQLKAMFRPEQLAWISLGLLRFTPELKPIVEQKFPQSKIIYGEFFPGADKKMRYPEPIRIKVFSQFRRWLKEWDSALPVYFCMESKRVWQEVMAGLPGQVNELNAIF